MESELRVAVIGCGNIAKAHLEAMADLPARPMVMVDIIESRAQAYAERYGPARHYTEIADAFADDVEAVLICLPHHLHRPAAVGAAERGKHILTEKPMAMSLREADEMIAAAQASGVCLMVGQVLRHRGANVRARQLIRDGRIGRPCNIIRRRLSRSLQSPVDWATDPAQAGGWVLYGFGSHEVDTMLWLFDTHATRVYAQAATNNPHWNDYDEVTVQMALANGTIATLNHSINATPGAWDTVITGTDASMYVTNEQIVLVGSGAQPEKIDVPMGPAMKVQLREFIDAVREGRQPEASGADVRRTMQALEAAKRSIATGQIIDTAAL